MSEGSRHNSPNSISRAEGRSLPRQSKIGAITARLAAGRQTAARSGGNDHDHALLRLLRQALRPHVRPRSGALLLLPGLPASDGGPPARLERQDGHPADRRAARGGAGPLRPPPRHGGRTAGRSLLEVKRTAPGSTARRRQDGGRMAEKWNWPLLQRTAADLMWSRSRWCPAVPACSLSTAPI